MKCSCFLIYFPLHHPYIGMPQQLRSIEDGAAVASPLDVAWLPGEPVQGLERPGNELWGLPDEASALPAQSRGSLGPWGPGVAGHARPERSGHCSRSSAAPPASPGTTARARCDGLEANRESLLPLFLDGEYSMFFRERGQPLFQGQWPAGERGHRVPGACAGCCGRGEESPFCL